MPINNPQTTGALPGLTLKAWARVTSAGVLISGFNIASVVRTAAGSYTVTYTSAMATTTYIVRINMVESDFGVYTTLTGVRVATKAAGSVQVRLVSNNALNDNDFFLEVYE